MNELTPHTIQLQIGHVQKGRRNQKDTLHRSVSFGKRINGKTLFAIDADPQSDIPTQYADLLMRASIVKFGTLKMPVSLGVLLGLDSVDREALSDAFAVFTA